MSHVVIGLVVLAVLVYVGYRWWTSHPSNTEVIVNKTDTGTTVTKDVSK